MSAMECSNHCGPLYQRDGQWWCLNNYCPNSYFFDHTPRSATIHVGDSVLTRDIVWCQCGRGISLTGKWVFCPNCGLRIDQASYTASCEQAIKNGARLYQDADAPARRDLFSEREACAKIAENWMCGCGDHGDEIARQIRSRKP